MPRGERNKRMGLDEPIRWDGYVDGKLVAHLYTKLSVDRWKEQNPQGESANAETGGVIPRSMSGGS